MSPATSSLGAEVRLDDLIKTYGTFAAVDDISVTIARGEFFTILGPSGSGKTTTMMMVAGFTYPTSGSIRIADRNVADLPPQKRDLGMVFQNYAVFPHLSVFENVAFPLRVRKVPKAEIVRAVNEILDLVKLREYSARMPRQLSGGQQQRVALARALVFRPSVLLMDEPLGALDKKLRDHMQTEIRRIHRQLGVTVIYVTHDQGEALTMSDRIAIMNQGRIEQIGTPADLYDRPDTRFVADFLGDLDEMLRRDGPEFRVVPPRQSLVGRRLLRLKIDQGLKVQFQTVLVDGFAQVAFESEARLHLGIQLGIEEAEGAAARHLGGIKRNIRILQKTLGRIGALSHIADADADADIDLSSIECKRRVHQPAQSLGDVAGMTKDMVRHHKQRKLVAAQPRDPAPSGGQFFEAPGQFLEDRVAGIVAMGVVDALEVVDIDEHQRQIVACARIASKRGENLLKPPPVRQSGQRIVVCGFPQIAKAQDQMRDRKKQQKRQRPGQPDRHLGADEYAVAQGEGQLV